MAATATVRRIIENPPKLTAPPERGPHDLY
jgi:hypothetical protein